MSNVPLVDHGAMLLYATRRTRLLPNMAFIRRFPDPIPREDLETEAARLTSNKYGLGRSLMMPVIPGARPVWRAHPQPPAVRIAEGVLDHGQLSAWLTREMSQPVNPLGQLGWNIVAAHSDDGSMFVAIVCNHLYGTGRDIALAVCGDYLLGPDSPPRDGSDGQGPPLTADTDHDVKAEVVDLLQRLRAGSTGAWRLGAGILPGGPQRREVESETASVRRPINALMDRDKTRGKPSPTRTTVLSTVPWVAWDAVANEHGGSRLALQLAVTANLLREARKARGGEIFRPIRIIVPVDVADRTSIGAVGASLEAVDLTAAEVVISGGLPQYGDLTEIRKTIRDAIEDARQEVAATGEVPVAPGMVDAMRLLPVGWAARAVMRVHARFDGAVSAVGPLRYPGLDRLGEHFAEEVYPVAFPMGSDISLTAGEFDDSMTIGLVADPSRLGAGPSLRERFAAELDRWGLTERTIW